MSDPSTTEDLESNPFINESEQTPFQDESLSSPPAPASIPLPSSFSAEAYPQDDPPAELTSEPVVAEEESRARSASVAESERPAKDAIQVGDERFWDP